MKLQLNDFIPMFSIKLKEKEFYDIMLYFIFLVAPSLVFEGNNAKKLCRPYRAPSI